MTAPSASCSQLVIAHMAVTLRGEECRAWQIGNYMDLLEGVDAVLNNDASMSVQFRQVPTLRREPLGTLKSPRRIPEVIW